MAKILIINNVMFELQAKAIRNALSGPFADKFLFK
jgi:hypothetical protein